MSPRFNSPFWAVLRRLPKLITGRGLNTRTGDDHEWLDDSWFTRLRGRSLFLRHLNTGSSNASDLGISALENAVYDFERLGFHIVASPRHADMLLVTGPMTLNLIPAAEATFDAMPIPEGGKGRYIIAVGDDARGGGIFRETYGVLGHLPRDDMEEAVIGEVEGPAPRPSEVLEGLCRVVNALSR